MKHESIDEIQKRVYQNKLNHRFNVTNVEKEFCLLYGEVAELYEAWRKHLPTVGEEMADVAIYLLGLAEILHINLESEIERKMDIIEQRVYQIINGVNTRMPGYTIKDIKKVDCSRLHEELIEAIRRNEGTAFQRQIVDELSGYDEVEFSRLFTIKDKPSTQEAIAIIIFRYIDATGGTVHIRENISSDSFEEFRKNLKREIDEKKVLINS